MRKILVALCLILSTPAWPAATPCSVTIPNANQPYTLISAPQPPLNLLLLQNIQSGEALWFAFNQDAAIGGLGSFTIPPAQSGAFSNPSMLLLAFPTPSSFAKLSVVAATAGHKVSCAYW